MSTLLDLIWFDILVVLIGVTVVVVARTRHRVPALARIAGPPKSSALPTPRDADEDDVHQIGFQYLGDFDVAIRSDVSCTLRAYRDPHGQSECALISMATVTGSTSAIEFSSDLGGKYTLMTSASRAPGPFSYPLTKIIVRAPWKKTAQRLHDLHSDLCSVAATYHYSPLDLRGTCFEDRVRGECRRDLDRQVGRGRFRRLDDGTYAWTLRGAVLAVPRIWLDMSYGLLCSWYTVSDRVLRERFRRRLDQPPHEALE